MSGGSDVASGWASSTFRSDQPRKYARPSLTTGPAPRPKPTGITAPPRSPMTTMANSCRLCRTDVPDESTGQVCRDCAHAAASYVLERPAREVELFWVVDETFGNRREHFLRLAPRRRDSGAETYGGLAIGYLSIGL